MNKRPWTDEELKQLWALAVAGGTVRATAKLNRSIANCRDQARKMGKPFTHVRIKRMNIRAKCTAAEES